MINRPNQRFRIDVVTGYGHRRQARGNLVHRITQDCPGVLLRPNFGAAARSNPRLRRRAGKRQPGQHRNKSKEEAVHTGEIGVLQANVQ